MTDRDTACIVQFENEQVRLLRERGWHVDIIDMDIWRQPVDGLVVTSRYAVRVSRKEGGVWWGTVAGGDTPESAVTAIVRRLAILRERAA